MSQQTKSDGITLKAIDLQRESDITINSTQVKKLIKHGKIELVNQLLGHSFSIIGKIKKGNQIGRTIGFPTANFSNLEQIIPEKGVYFGHLLVNKDKDSLSPLKQPKSAKLSVLNIGTRPTIKNNNHTHVSIEAHIIDEKLANDELYGKTCAFYCKGRLREECKFPNLKTLKLQIAKDIETAKQKNLQFS